MLKTLGDPDAILGAVRSDALRIMNAYYNLQTDLVLPPASRLARRLASQLEGLEHHQDRRCAVVGTCCAPASCSPRRRPSGAPR